MIRLLFTTFILMTTLSVMSQESIHKFIFETIDGQQKSFADYKGKKILIFNAASKCGFTKQYKELEELYHTYGAKLAVIGFPANNFGNQEPGTNDEIAEFCQKNYGVSFTMAAKVSVKGEDQHAIFKWLCAQENKSFTGDIKWNFEKFLLDEDGKLIERFRSQVSPMDKKITRLIYR